MFIDQSFVGVHNSCSEMIKPWVWMSIKMNLVVRGSKAVHSLDCFEDIENRSLEMQSILRMTHNNQFQ
jgi:hypothetical protein